MVNTADLQKTITNPLIQEGKPQKVNGKEVGCSQRAASKQINIVVRKAKVWKKKVLKQQSGEDCQ